MIRPSQALRLFYINRVLVRHGLDEVILATHLFRPLRFLFFLLPWNWLGRRDVSRGERIRRALEDLGPVFVKFGQISSTRRDLLPDDIADELAKLQDQVPPFPTHIARKIIEKSFGKKIEEVFEFFDDKPMASASVSQVYKARLKDSGREVVVKVIRPGIAKTIHRDLSLLELIAGMGERYSAEARRLKPLEIVGDYKKTIFDELDLVREASNASQLRRNFKDSDKLYVPEIHWPLTHKRVMVMERISGIPVSHVDVLKAKNVNLKKLAERGVEIFFSQVFEHNFFHADMHPGNIFISAENPEDAKYIAVDFGIMGSLSERDKDYLAHNFLAFFKRDYRRVAQLHLDSGWVPAHVRLEEFESAIRTVCEPIFERPLKEISFGKLLMRLFQTVRRFDFEIQPQLILLQKTLLNIEGLGRQLYPDLDLWTTAKPFLERSMRQRMFVREIINKIPGNPPQWLDRLPDLPSQLVDLVDKANAGKLQLQLDDKELKNIEYEIKRHSRRSFFTVLGSSLLISAAVIFGLDGLQPHSIYGVPLQTWVLGGLGALVLIFAWPDN